MKAWHNKSSEKTQNPFRIGHFLRRILACFEGGMKDFQIWQGFTSPKKKDGMLSKPYYLNSNKSKKGSKSVRIQEENKEDLGFKFGIVNSKVKPFLSESKNGKESNIQIKDPSDLIYPINTPSYGTYFCQEPKGAFRN